MSVPGDSPGKDARRRCTTSKLADVRTAYALARRLEPRGITVNAFDPGLVPGTGLARDARPVGRALFATLARALVVLPGVNTAATSSADLARLVTDPALATTGAYVVRRAATRSSAASYDVDAQEALHWDSLQLHRRAARPSQLVAAEGGCRFLQQMPLSPRHEGLGCGTGTPRLRRQVSGHTLTIVTPDGDRPAAMAAIAAGTSSSPIHVPTRSCGRSRPDDTSSSRPG